MTYIKEFHPNSLEFHLESGGIHRNLIFLPFQRIPAELMEEGKVLNLLRV